VAILCHHLDETIAEKIKEISAKVKVCNILTQNSKQFQKLEEQIYQENGIVLNVSTNVKRAVMKSGLVVNFDFEGKDLEKCVFSKKAFLISLNQNEEIQKIGWGEILLFLQWICRPNMQSVRRLLRDLMGAFCMKVSFIRKQVHEISKKN